MNNMFDDNVSEQYKRTSSKSSMSDIDVKSDVESICSSMSRSSKISKASKAPSWETKTPHQGPSKVSQDEILHKKRSILHDLERLASKNVKVPKFTMASNYEEMVFEHDRIKADLEVDSSLRFQRNALIGIVSGIEYLNQKFDPFDIKLDGWSERVSGQINTFDDVLEELFYKYKSKIQMAPEVSLLFALSSSMFFVHLANTTFKANAKPSPPTFPEPVVNSSMNVNFNKPVAKVTTRPVMRGMPNVSDMMKSLNNDDVISIMSDSDASSIRSSKSVAKKGGRRTMQI